MESLLKAYDKGNKIVKKERVCSLWANYGCVIRLTHQNSTSIVKFVELPEDDDVGNQRKVASYYNELYFYERYGFEDSICHIPGLLKASQQNSSIFLVLEDVQPMFPYQLGDLSIEETKVALRWLAHFHVRFWNKGCSEDGDILEHDSRIAQEGSYWYLATRQDELAAIPRQYRKLQQAAEVIDAKVKDRRYYTLIHGDAKSANIMFSADKKHCAMYDFQYTGYGLGAKDVAYLITSSTQRSVINQGMADGRKKGSLPVANSNDWYLDYYFDELTEEAQRTNINLNGYTRELFIEHFHWCLLDYVRFMAGWGFWGHSSWAIEKTSHLLDQL